MTARAELVRSVRGDAGYQPVAATYADRSFTSEYPRTVGVVVSHRRAGPSDGRGQSWFTLRSLRTRRWSRRADDSGRWWASSPRAGWSQCSCAEAGRPCVVSGRTRGWSVVEQRAKIGVDLECPRRPRAVPTPGTRPYPASCRPHARGASPLPVSATAVQLGVVPAHAGLVRRPGR
jgi:hypothetical protein